MKSFFKAAPAAAPSPPPSKAKAFFGGLQARHQQRLDAEALRARQQQGEQAAIYNRAALVVGAHQAQQHARALADAALATPGEKPEVEAGVQAQRKRKTAAIRI